MADEIATKTENMEKDIKELRSLLKRAKETVEQLFGEIKSLDAMWDGAANDAFNIQFMDDYQYSLDVCDSVGELIDCISFAKEEYEKCETEVSDIVHAIRL